MKDTKALNGRYFLSKFQYHKTYTTWNGVGQCDPGWHIRAVKWQDGLWEGSGFDNTKDGLCNKVPTSANTQRGQGNYSKNTSTGYHYGVAVTVWGANLGASSGYTTTVMIHHYFHHRSWICGADGKTVPYKAHNVAIGPEY